MRAPGAYLSVYSVDDRTIVEVYSWVLTNVDVSDGREQEILKTLNALNRGHRFGMLWLDETTGKIVLEHHLLGDQLDGAELMNVLSAVVGGADGLDDELIKEFGTGERWADVLAREAKDDGPTIST